MSTHSRIGYFEPKDGMIHSVYCHSDGYLEHNGKMLVEHYSNLNKLRRLISQGSISFLDVHISTLSAPKPLEPRYKCFSDYAKGWKHTYDTPAKGVTTFHFRDRGEAWDWCKPFVSHNFTDEQEYNYLYKAGKWAYCHPWVSHDWKPIPADFKELVEA